MYVALYTHVGSAENMEIELIKNVPFLIYKKAMIYMSLETTIGATAFTP